MKRKIAGKVFPSVGLICLLLSGPASGPAHAAVIQFNEFRITSNSSSQEQPDIYDLNIVYQDNRNGDWDIYVYRLAGAIEPETRITTDAANQVNPRIYGGRVVYQDDRNGNWDIYMYDLAAQTETRITDNASYQGNPAIDGNRIVWHDNRHGDWQIYLYDLSSQTETRVTTSGSNTYPAVFGNGIVYIKHDVIEYTKAVCYFDLSSGSEVALAEYSTWPGGPRTPGHPATAGSRVVWDLEQNESGLPEVRMRDLGTGATWIAERNSARPAISEPYAGAYYAVYQGWVYASRNSHWGISLYHTELQTEYTVSNAASTQLNPRVSGGRIVYMDDRNGNWDIYMTMVGYVAGDPSLPTPAAAIGKIQGIQRLIADPARIPASHIEGASAKVEENRRNALLNKLDAVIASIQAAADSKNPANKRAAYQGAIGHLSAILGKTDGCSLRGTPDGEETAFTPDWIITCESQELLEPRIRDAMRILEALLE